MSYILTDHPDVTAKSPVVEDHLDALVGLGQASLADLPKWQLRNEPGRLRIADLLRERADETIAVGPVRAAVPLEPVCRPIP